MERILYVGVADDRYALLKGLNYGGATIECAPFFVPGPWKTVVLPAQEFFTGEYSQQRSADFLVYGPAHLLRPAFVRGALDYLREPWTAEELFLRAGFLGSGPLSWSMAGTAFHLDGDVLRAGERSVRLSGLEAELLGFLARRQGKTVSVAALVHHLYGNEAAPKSRVVTTLVSRLRARLRSLAPPEAGNAIVSRRGLGYRIP